MRRPLRLPNQFDLYFADLRNARQAIVYLLEDQAAGRALRGGQAHRDLYTLAGKGWRRVWIGLRSNIVDQPEIDEIQLHFRIEAVPQRIDDLFRGQER